MAKGDNKPLTTNKICLCGSKAILIKNNSPVCRDCHAIEEIQYKYKASRAHKTRLAVEPFNDPSNNLEFKMALKQKDS